MKKYANTIDSTNSALDALEIIAQACYRHVSSTLMEKLVWVAGQVVVRVEDGTNMISECFCAADKL